jgi:hypothetical protein
MRPQPRGIDEQAQSLLTIGARAKTGDECFEHLAGVDLAGDLGMRRSSVREAILDIKLRLTRG